MLLIKLLITEHQASASHAVLHLIFPQSRCLFILVRSIRSSFIKVPAYVLTGDHAVLMCNFQSKTPIYSVRWYKGGKEFFRSAHFLGDMIRHHNNQIYYHAISFLPSKNTPVSVHNTPGIQVDVSRTPLFFLKRC